MKLTHDDTAAGMRKLYSVTTFLGSEGNAGVCTVPTHVLLCQVVPAVLMSVLGLLLPSSLDAQEGSPPSLSGSPTLTTENISNYKMFNVQGVVTCYNYSFNEEHYELNFC